MAENEYSDYSVFDSLNKITNDKIIIPDIQRDYCWSPYDIEELFRSIIDKFPIGSFIMWRTTGEHLNNCSSDFFHFLEEVKRKKYGFYKLSNRLLNKNFVNNESYDVILDGQQRLTSFYLALKGTYKVKKPGKGHDENEDNYEEKQLYYNLNRYTPSEDSELEPRPFQFLTDDEALEGNYYPVKDMMKYTDVDDFCTHIDEITKGLDPKTAKDLKLLFRRLNEDSRDKSLIHFYTINSNEYDEALDVFVRVNSSGVKLNKTDLLFGTLINKWPKDGKTNEGRRKEIEKYLDSINTKYDFNFTKDFLLRTCLVLVNNGKSGISMQDIAKNDVVKLIRDNWDKIKTAIENTADTMKDIDMNDAKVLSYNAIIPIIYYVYNGGKFPKNKGAKCRDELRKYFAVVFAKSLFGGSSDSAITNTCRSIASGGFGDFNCSLFDNTEFSGQRNFAVDLRLINKWMEQYNKGSKTYFLLMLLSPNLNILEDSYDQDHSHADTLFTDKYLEDCGVPSNKWELWKSKRSHLPNLSFMQASRNRSKNKTDLKTWMEENKDKISSLKTLPVLDDYSLNNFEQFYVLRRSMMKYTLTTLFSTQKDELNVNDIVSVNVGDPAKGLLYGMHGKIISINEDKANIEFMLGGSPAIREVDIESLYLVEPFDKEFDI